jgi:valyl-tRNA synthetase
VRWVLREVLDSLLRMLHPFMPFITEELFQALGQRGWVQALDTIQRAAWPKADASAQDAAAEREVALLIDVVRTVRNMRAELKIEPAKLAQELHVVAVPADKPVLDAVSGLVGRLARAEKVLVHASAPALGKAATGLAGENQIFLPLEQFGDVIAKEIQRLGKEQAALEAEQQRVAGQLGNEAFVAKAPAAVVDKLRARQDELKVQLETVRQTLEKWK